VIETTRKLDLDDVRADFVGSFLRPQSLKDAYEQFDAGDIDATALASAQDSAIRTLIAEQDSRGLPIAGDGEFRRRVFMESFSDVAGLDPWRASLTAEAARVTAAAAVTTAAKSPVEQTKFASPW
jgi:methionine synthase II (cobalamin-independent)